MTSRTIRIGAGVGAVAALAAPLTAIAATSGSATKTPAPTATSTTTSGEQHFRVRARDDSRVDGLAWVAFTKANERLIVRVKVHGLAPGTTHAITIDRGTTVLYRLKSIKADANGHASSSNDLTKVATWRGKGVELRIHRTASDSSETVATAHA